MRSPIENLPGKPSPPPPPPYVDKYLQFDFYQGGQSHRSYHRVGRARFKRDEEEVITTSSILQCHFKLLFLLLVWGLAIKVTTAWSPVTLSVMKPLTIHTASTCHYSTACSHFNILGAVPSYRQRTKTGLSVKDTQGQN